MRTGRPRVPVQERFWAKVKKTKTCWLWTGHKNSYGYGMIGEGRAPMQYAHRVSWRLHYGSPPRGLFVCHKCDVRSCVNPAHLFLGTPAENSADMASKGRSAKRAGHLNTMAKLTGRDIETILSLRAAGKKQREIAARFNVRQSTISRILAGKRWTRESKEVKEVKYA